MKKIILISLMSFATFSHASTNGNNLIEGYKAYVKATDETSDLSGGEMYKGAFFQGFVSATSDATENNAWCSPASETVTNAQVYDVVGQYLTNHPEKRSQQGIYIVRDALSLAFPCPR